LKTNTTTNNNNNKNIKLLGKKVNSMEIGSGPNSPNKNTNNNNNNNNVLMSDDDLLNRLDTLDHPPSKRLLTTSNSKHLLTQPQIATTPTLTPIETNEELVDEEITKMDSSATIKQENDKQQLESSQLTNNETTTTPNVDQNDNENIDDGLFKLHFF
jgi:hypothetical protein